MLDYFGTVKLLGKAVEIYGEEVDKMSLDDRVTISSMATEMGAIILLFPPNREVLRYCEARMVRPLEEIKADKGAKYSDNYELDASGFEPRVSLPGKPHNTVPLSKLEKVKIDSVFIGSCTNGRLSDMRTVAAILKGKVVAPGVVLKIVPSTDLVWQHCLDEGILEVFKEAGAMISNAGCAGCASGQVGQNGPGEVTVSTGNRNFPGKQGKGEVYLSSPAVAAASAVSGYISDKAEFFEVEPEKKKTSPKRKTAKQRKKNEPAQQIIQGRSWYIPEDDIDTDMIFHNRYLTITDISEMGKYSFDNLKGYEDFASRAEKGDVILTGKNFGAGSSRQQAVDCFKAIGIQAIIAESFGAIYERNAINAAFPVLVCPTISQLNLETGDEVKIDLKTGEIINLANKKKTKAIPFSEVQFDIYNNGGLF